MVRPALRQGRARVSPVASVAVRPVRAERLAAGRSLARPRVVGAGAAARRVVRAVRPCQVARPFRVAPAAAPLVPAVRLAAERPGAGAARCGGGGGGATGCPRCSPLPGCSALPRCSGGWRRWCRRQRLAAERPEPAPRVAAAGAAARRVVRAVPPCHVARPFRVAPVVVLPVRGGVACDGAPPCVGAPGAPEIAGAAGAFRSSDFPRASSGPGTGLPPAADAWSAALFVSGATTLTTGAGAAAAGFNSLRAASSSGLARLRCQLLLLRRETDGCRRAARCGRRQAARTRGQAACRLGRRRHARFSRSEPRAERTPPARWQPFPALPGPPPCPTGCDCTNAVVGTATTAPGTCRLAYTTLVTFVLL